jgi:hypothetical protein
MMPDPWGNGGSTFDVVTGVQAVTTETGLISDEELAALALAADPDEPLAPDAVAWVDPSAPETALLPAFYMPAAVAPVRSRWKRAVGLTVVACIVGINAFGFCITYGVLELA